jgi:phenylalanyl-tRNA synthetase beta chain
MDQLPAVTHKKPKPIALSNLQTLYRDFAFLVDNTVSADQLVRAIKKADQKYLDNVRVFDVYHGEKVPVGKKSIAVEVRLQPKDKTFVDQDIQDISQKIIDICEKQCGAQLRMS